jgi:hypothetical protein
VRRDPSSGILSLREADRSGRLGNTHRMAITTFVKAGAVGGFRWCRGLAEEWEVGIRQNITTRRGAKAGPALVNDARAGGGRRGQGTQEASVRRAWAPCGHGGTASPVTRRVARHHARRCGSATNFGAGGGPPSGAGRPKLCTCCRRPMPCAATARSGPRLSSGGTMDFANARSERVGCRRMQWGQAKTHWRQAP